MNDTGLVSIIFVNMEDEVILITKGKKLHLPTATDTQKSGESVDEGAIRSVSEELKSWPSFLTRPVKTSAVVLCGKTKVFVEAWI